MQLRNLLSLALAASSCLILASAAWLVQRSQALPITVALLVGAAAIHMIVTLAWLRSRRVGRGYGLLLGLIDLGGAVLVLMLGIPHSPATPGIPAIPAASEVASFGFFGFAAAGLTMLVGALVRAPTVEGVHLDGPT